MATIIQNFAPATDSANIQEIYQQCLYRPTKTVEDGKESVTFEALNGGLSEMNLKDSDKRRGISSYSGLFREEKFKAGTFARGYFYGFNFPERYHQHQFNIDKNQLKTAYTPGKFSNRVRAAKRYFTPSYQLGCSVFIPYKSVVYITYQGFFASDGIRQNFPDYNYTETNSDRKVYIGEFYNNRLYVNGKYEPGTEVITPTSRRNDTCLPYEYRWRWNHKAKMIHLDKGYHDISVMVYPSLCVDKKAGKQQIYCGSISVLAVKRGILTSESNNPEWYGLDIKEYGIEPPPPPSVSGAVNIPPPPPGKPEAPQPPPE
tara:strand:+ start:311 stop:1258 length:948 start_codon:yes stop_codon:yes gene_type:complete